MTDPIRSFVAEFTEFLDQREDDERLRPRSRAAAKQSLRLAQMLDDLQHAGARPCSLSGPDLRRLADELSDVDVPARGSLDAFVNRAEALLTVVEDGFVDADSEVLSTLLARARGLSNRPRRSRQGGASQLAVPVRVRCATCEKYVSGKQAGATEWTGIAKRIRSHERKAHGDYSSMLREELRSLKARILDGDVPVMVGHYEFLPA